MAITDTKDEIIKKRGYRQNIHGDQYVLYLSNYPVAAKYLSTRVKGHTLIELCCALGITLEALSDNFDKLIGIDIDSKVLKDCRKNLEEANLSEKIELLQRDVSDDNTFVNLKADVVIYDIPYWVPKILADGSLNIDKNPDLKTIVENIRKYITSNIIIFAPPQLDYEIVRGLLGDCEYEQIYINGRYDRNYIYFGNLIKQTGIFKKELSY